MNARQKAKKYKKEIEALKKSVIQPTIINCSDLYDIEKIKYCYRFNDEHFTETASRKVIGEAVDIVKEGVAKSAKNYINIEGIMDEYGKRVVGTLFVIRWK